mgnify:CR=1 FL=1
MSFVKSRQWSQTLIGPVLIIVVIHSIEAFLTYAVKDASLRLASSDILSVVINLLASIALFWAAYQSKAISKRLGLAWLLMALGQLVYTLGDFFWFILEVIVKESPYPSIADLFYAVYYPLFFSGAILLSLENHVIIQKFKNTLDMAIIMSGAFLLYWYILLQPISENTLSEPWYVRALAAAYPVGDILLLAAILWLLNSNPNRNARPQVITLLASVFVMIIADTFFSYQSLQGTYESSTLLDFGWTFSYTLTGLAGLQQVLAVKNRKNLRKPDTQDKESGSFRKNVLAFAPYFWLILAYLILYFGKSHSDPQYFTYLYIWVGVIVGMVLVRQAGAFLEIKSLNKKLKDLLRQVEQQARDLVTINQELESEIQLRVRVEEQLSFDALHDSLTNLPNRALFFQRLEHALENIKNHPDSKYSVLFMDIDQFKVINDSLGHGMGDQLLMIIAQRLTRCLRETDTVARLGGDEFVFLLENTSDEHMIDFIVNRINEEVQKVIMLENHPVFVTTSIGVVLDIKPYTTPGNILRDADLAMYRAKALGKGRFEIFQDGMHLQAISRLEIEEDLRRALQNQELELSYQPIQRISTGEFIGFEALIRWDHPKYGILLPGEFLGVAEETGLNQSIGWWVFARACTQIAAWQEKYPACNECFISINVSGRQISNSDLIPQIKKVIKQTGVKPSSIHLEITENTLIEGSEATIRKFEQLHELGIHLAIDDFGTGYSSLAYLQHFPVQTLKIDQSFIRGIGIKKSSLNVIKSMITLAHDLGLEIVAEGIETPSQLEELKKIGCDLAQGYLLSLPLSVDSAETFLRENHMKRIGTTAPQKM